VSNSIAGLTERGGRPLKLAVVLTALALLLAIALLIKETAYMFVVFMFLGPTLLLLAVAALGWVILQELRAKRVL
jgi:hypothetical protein